MENSLVLAIETSCDDTSVALVNSHREVIEMLSAGQEEAHAPFGGIVPEIAGRNHSENLLPLIEKIVSSLPGGWRKISAIAVTNRPGLVGSLLVGVVTAKTLAWSMNKPLIGINHIIGHLWAPFLDNNKQIKFPFISLAISGGHTQLVLVENEQKFRIIGKTLDDAAGEAFDKFAKLIGFAYPGGVKVDEKAQNGDKNSFQFPRPLIKSKDLNFSFSGLKTSAMNTIKKLSEEQRNTQIENLCASYQEAIVDVLLAKLKLATTRFDVSTVCLTGGVSANSRLRSVISTWATKNNYDYFQPQLKYCTDNAAMIGLAAIICIKNNCFSSYDLPPSPSSFSEDFYYEN